MDVWYVENRSLALDLRIILRTPLVVMRGKGVSSTSSETMPELRPELEGPAATPE
jgi:hypothetical protein